MEKKIELLEKKQSTYNCKFKYLNTNNTDLFI